MNKNTDRIITEALDSADDFAIAGFVATIISTLPYKDDKEANISIIIGWLHGNGIYNPSIENKKRLCEEFSINDVRVCDVCGKISPKGYTIDNDKKFACSKECAINIYERYGYDGSIFERDLAACEKDGYGEVMDCFKIKL